MSDIPLPMTAPDCDLRGLAFMPLDTVRLMDSDLFALSTGDEFKAALALWCKSWQQVPAGSLPDDARVLAHLSGAGARWGKVKAVALRNWIKCSDGRLYHAVVAEKANEALPMRKEYQEKKSGEVERKARERGDRKRMFDQLRSVGVTPEYNTKTRDLREMVTAHVTEEVTDTSEYVTGQVTLVTRTVTAKTGTGTGTESKKEEDDRLIGSAGDARVAVGEAVPEPILDLTTRLCDAAGFKAIVNPGVLVATAEIVKSWIHEGFDPDLEMLPAIRSVIQKSDDPTSSMRRFDRAIRHLHAQRKGECNAPSGSPNRFDAKPSGDGLSDAFAERLASLGVG